MKDFPEGAPRAEEDLGTSLFGTEDTGTLDVIKPGTVGETGVLSDGQAHSEPLWEAGLGRSPQNTVQLHRTVRTPSGAPGHSEKQFHEDLNQSGRPGVTNTIPPWSPPALHQSHLCSGPPGAGVADGAGTRLLTPGGPVGFPLPGLRSRDCAGLYGRLGQKCLREEARR